MRLEHSKTDCHHVANACFRMLFVVLLVLVSGCGDSVPDEEEVLAVTQQVLLKRSREIEKEFEEMGWDAKMATHAASCYREAAEFLQNRRTLSRPYVIAVGLAVIGHRSNSREGLLSLSWLEPATPREGIVLSVSGRGGASYRLPLFSHLQPGFPYTMHVKRVPVIISDEHDVPVLNAAGSVGGWPSVLQSMVLVLPRRMLHQPLTISVYNKEHEAFNSRIVFVSESENSGP